MIRLRQDFDGGTIGQTFTQVILNNTGAHDQISWQVIDSAQFVNGPSDLEDIVVDERCWVVVSSACHLAVSYILNT